MMYSGEVDA